MWSLWGVRTSGKRWGGLAPPQLIRHWWRDADWGDAGPSLSGNAARLASREVPVAEKVLRGRHVLASGLQSQRAPVPPHPTAPRMSEVLCLRTPVPFLTRLGAPWSLNGCQADMSTASARTPVSWSLRCHCSVIQQQAWPQRPGSREGLTQRLRNYQPRGSWVPGPCELPGVDDAPQSSKSVSVHPSCPYKSIS